MPNGDAEAAGPPVEAVVDPLDAVVVDYPEVGNLLHGASAERARLRHPALAPPEHSIPPGTPKLHLATAAKPGQALASRLRSAISTPFTPVWFDFSGGLS